jgi:hypothetical protein
MNSPTLSKILDSNPLAVLMVLTALERFSAEVAATKPEDYPPLGLVNPESWIALAQDIHNQLTERKAFK